MLEVKVENCAGIDVGKKFLTVPGNVLSDVWKFRPSDAGSFIGEQTQCSRNGIADREPSFQAKLPGQPPLAFWVLR